ncbi:MAG: hypothetical protein SGJ00_06555 [bacterium]|nr:hypothetical protein [bacterium]
MKTIRNLIAIFIACVFILGACKKTTTSDQKPKFDNSMLGLWLITKSVGTTPFAVNDSFVVRNDKFNSGYDTKSSIDTIQNRITIYDYLGNSTAWNITKNSSEEFQLDNGSGSMFSRN